MYAHNPTYEIHYKLEEIKKLLSWLEDEVWNVYNDAGPDWIDEHEAITYGQKIESMILDVEKLDRDIL